MSCSPRNVTGRARGVLTWPQNVPEPNLGEPHGRCLKTYDPWSAVHMRGLTLVPAVWGFYGSENIHMYARTQGWWSTVWQFGFSSLCVYWLSFCLTYVLTFVRREKAVNTFILLLIICFSGSFYQPGMPVKSWLLAVSVFTFSDTDVSRW